MHEKEDAQRLTGDSEDDFYCSRGLPQCSLMTVLVRGVSNERATAHIALMERGR